MIYTKFKDNFKFVYCPSCKVGKFVKSEKAMTFAENFSLCKNNDCKQEIQVFPCFLSNTFKISTPTNWLDLARDILIEQNKEQYIDSVNESFHKSLSYIKSNHLVASLEISRLIAESVYNKDYSIFNKG